MVSFPERNVKLSYLGENVVDIDTRGQNVVVVREMDKERSVEIELLSNDSMWAKNHKEVESAPHPLTSAEGTWCIDQYRRLLWP